MTTQTKKVSKKDLNKTAIIDNLYSKYLNNNNDSKASCLTCYANN